MTIDCECRVLLLSRPVTEPHFVMSRIDFGLATPNVLAAVVAVAISALPVLTVWCYTLRRRRLMALVGCAVMAITLAIILSLTASRGGSLAALLGVGMSVMLLPDRAKLIPLSLIGCILASMAMTTQLRPTQA